MRILRDDLHSLLSEFEELAVTIRQRALIELAKRYLARTSDDQLQALFSVTQQPDHLEMSEPLVLSEKGTPPMTTTKRHPTPLEVQLRDSLVIALERIDADPRKEKLSLSEKQMLEGLRRTLTTTHDLEALRAAAPAVKVLRVGLDKHPAVQQPTAPTEFRITRSGGTKDPPGGS